MIVCGIETVDVTLQQLLLLSLMAFLIGVGKAGFSGLSLIPVSVFALYFGKSSVGIILPLLVVADLTVYPVMRKHGNWKEVWPLLPPTLFGIVIGFFTLNKISDDQARTVIGIAISMMLVIISLKRLSPSFFRKVTKGNWFSYFSAILGGVATTLANAAGPIIKIYLLSKRFSKLDLVGISARFFLLINLIKLPLMGAGQLVTEETLVLNVKLVGFVIVGVFIGKMLLQLISQKWFDWLVIIFAILAAARLLL